MKFFDSNACFGKDVVNHQCVNHENFIMMEKVDLAETAGELIAQMDYAGIEKAMVWYRPQFDGDPIQGNEEMMDMIKGGMDANEAMKKAMGTYGRVQDAVKMIDPRHE